MQKMETYFGMIERVYFLDCALSGLCTVICDEMCANIMKEPVCAYVVVLG